MLLDMEQMAIEYATAYADKSRIYFIEKYLSTFNATAGRLMPFQLFPRQKVFLHSIADYPASIAIKHRQCGITTVSSAWVAAQMVFAAPDAPETILCIGNKLDLANALVTKIREFLMQVPRWYWGDEYYSPDPKSEKNKKDIFIKNSKSELELFNGCKVYARSSGENAARGISAVSVLILDEAAFIENGRAVYTSAVAASASNPNRKLIMVSTPNGKDELYYDTYRQALAKENNYNAVEFKWYQDLRYNKNLKWYKKNEITGEKEWIIEDVLDETGTVRYDEEKWRKLEQEGWKPTNNWYQEMCMSFNNDPMKIAQELDVSFLGSANNVVAPEFIDMHSTLNVREPLEDLKDPMTDDTWFWKPPIDGHRYICACLPEGEKVMTQRGLVEVENIQADDLLLTKEGEFTPIKHRKYRDVVDEEVVKVKLCNVLNEEVFTHNHPIWASIDSKNLRVYKGRDNDGIKHWEKEWFHNFDYHDASQLIEDGWVEVPNFYRLNTISEVEMIKYWDDYRCVGLKRYSNINCPFFSEDFWWYCGMWLAEGYLHYDKHKNISVTTCHHQKETWIHEKISKLTNDLFLRKATVSHHKHTKGTQIGFYSKQIGIFLKDNFGTYAHHKYISEWIKRLPIKYKIKIVEGYLDGDGYISNGDYYAESVSKNLLLDIQDILLSCGINCSVSLRPPKKGKRIIEGRVVNVSNTYRLILGNTSTCKFLSLIGKKIIKEESKNAQRKSLYFSDDLSKIYIRISKIEKYKYTGRVYNFETVSDSHSFCGRYIATHNCDPSKGTSEDKTAIEIIDMDGRDENGLPIIEQVMEYNGRKLGDEIGGMIYQYATMYNNAFVVIDCTGGVGDSCILTLIQLGYKNLYYEDANQKTYTIQNSTKYSEDYSNRLPGFHFQGNRYPVLAGFAGMVRNNEFKIRSVRVINELDTWIFKEGTGRMDHQSGKHDDCITCLAMALFVMQYTVNKLETSKNKDAAILSAYMLGGGMSTKRVIEDRVDMRPKGMQPMYNQRTLKGGYPDHVQGNFLWLFGKPF